MLNKIRPAALAAITLMGVFHLHTASATPVANDRCDDIAGGYGAGYCEGSTGGNWSTGEVVYSCNSDGSVTIWDVSCQ